MHIRLLNRKVIFLVLLDALFHPAALIYGSIRILSALVTPGELKNSTKYTIVIPTLLGGLAFISVKSNLIGTLVDLFYAYITSAELLICKEESRGNFAGVHNNLFSIHCF